MSSAYCPKQLQSTIQDILYPIPRVPKTFMHHELNLKRIKDIQVENKQNQEAIKNQVIPEPFKLKQFKNIPSKWKENTNEWIQKESQLRKIEKEQKEINNHIHLDNKSPNNKKLKCSQELNHGLYSNKISSDSMFENYYKNKMTKSLRESSIVGSGIYERNYSLDHKEHLPYTYKGNSQANQADIDKLIEEYNSQLNINNNVRSSIQNNQNLQNIPKDDYLNSNINNNQNLQSIPEDNNSNENIDQLIEQYNNQLETIKEKEKVNENLKANINNTSKSVVKLPKIQNRNYVLENKRLITENKIRKKSPKKEEESGFHKDYGKTPEYLKQYMIEEEKHKEYQKLQKEKAKYPRGTRLVGEEEKLQTLNDLTETKKNIMSILEKMPIARLSLRTQKKKEELLQKLDDIEKALELFSRKKVFIREEE